MPNMDYYKGVNEDEVRRQMEVLEKALANSIFNPIFRPNNSEREKKQDIPRDGDVL